MFRIYGALIEMMAAAVFVIPIFCIYHKCRFHSRSKTILYLIFAFYLTAVLALVGFPNITMLKIEPAVNVIPFLYMMADLKNACLNVLLFVPFGIFLPIFWQECRDVKRIAVVGLLATVFIEAAQIFAGRATDIDDIITNSLGTLLGYFIARRATGNFARVSHIHEKCRDLYLICGTVVGIMFFLQPFLSEALWGFVL